MSGSAVYMYIPEIPGDVTAKGLEKHIELEGVKYGVSRNVNVKTGRTSNREGSLPTVTDCTVLKRIDKSTPLLLAKATGKDMTIPQVVLKFVSTGSEPQVYHTITLSNVMVTNRVISEKDHSAITGDNVDPNGFVDRPREEVSLNFLKVEEQFTDYDETGKPGSKIAAGFNVTTGQPC